MSSHCHPLVRFHISATETRNDSTDLPLEGFGVSTTAFPDGDGLPAHFSQGRHVFLVAVNVAFPLGCPKVRVGLRYNSPESAFVHVPEASMHKDGDFGLRKHHVRTAR